MKAKQSKALIKFIAFALALALSYYFGYYKAKAVFEQPVTTVASTSRQEAAASEKSPQKTNSDIARNKAVPAKVYEVLSYIDEHNRAPDGYVGGRNFGNFEKRLPLKSPGSKQKIKYREWDVNHKRQGKNRGAERLVTGNDQSAYFTDDHYESFTKIR